MSVIRGVTMTSRLSLVLDFTIIAVVTTILCAAIWYGWAKQDELDDARATKEVLQIDEAYKR